MWSQAAAEEREEAERVILSPDTCWEKQVYSPGETHKQLMTKGSHRWKRNTFYVK